MQDDPHLFSFLVRGLFCQQYDVSFPPHFSFYPYTTGTNGEYEANMATIILPSFYPQDY